MEKEKQIQAVNERILAGARTELYLHMRFLDVALSSFSYVMDAGIASLGTDGRGIYYAPGYLGGLYREGRREVNRAYLHMVLHCIFGHPWKLTRKKKEKACLALGLPVLKQEEEANLADILWDLACDAAVEAVIDGISLACLRRPMSWERSTFYRMIKEKRNVLHAEGIFAELTALAPSEEQIRLWSQEFCVDDHQLWHRRNSKNPNNQKPKEDWEDIRNRMETELETFGQEMAQGSLGLLEQVKAESRDTYDYRRFLQKFAVFREEAHLDAESFDYVFYSYGLSLYGNMPLLEPQETREVKKIEEFVIAIDTSMSCSGELVRAFLRETYSILREEESFFRKINLHILQCDEKIQKVKKINTQQELEAYMEKLELAGGGGTDFRPVFAYIAQLQAKREVTNLRGLLYFTDGKGIYPSKMPPYETAFLLMQKEYEEIQVPPWAVKLYLGEEDLLTL